MPGDLKRLNVKIDVATARRLRRYLQEKLHCLNCKSVTVDQALDAHLKKEGY